MGDNYRVVILGGGAGGLTVASHLGKSLPKNSIAIVEPSTDHYYQPGWTLVGGGQMELSSTRRSQADLIPEGVTWIRDRVSEIVPDDKRVLLISGASVNYDYLVVATGLQINYDKIKGLPENLGKGGVCSIYGYADAGVTYEKLRNFRGGTAVFTMPPVPIKCAGAPQKILYLADEIFSQNGVREKSTLIFATAGKAIFGVKPFADALLKVAQRKNIEVRYGYNLTEIHAAEKKAVFEVTTVTGKSTQSIAYDLLHAVPPMSAHPYVAASGLAFNDGPHKGWLKVDAFTLRHVDYPEIFGVGDITGVPNSKTAAAVRKQAPVVVNNLRDVMAGREPSAKYDGYSSCPLVTGIGKVILAEFGYDGKLLPSFPGDATRERWSAWLLKKYGLPLLYWQGMLKGRM